MKKNISKIMQIVIMILFIAIIAIVVSLKADNEKTVDNIIKNDEVFYEISNIPEYSGKIFIKVNNNIPNFTIEDINIEEDYYSNLENGRVRNGNDKN